MVIFVWVNHSKLLSESQDAENSSMNSSISMEQKIYISKECI